jgi:Zn-finger nucleic acid-binding protein
MRIDRDRSLLVCDYCGSQRETLAILARLEVLSETSNACPACPSALSAARLDDQRLLYCPRCFGMLIDMNRFATVIEAARAHEEGPRTVLPRRQNPGDRVLDCPQCRQPMLSHLYGGPGNVAIDSCERCLVNWLDAGELRRIAVAPDSQTSA